MKGDIVDTDHVISEVLVVARILDFAVFVHVPGAPAISATATALRALASDRAKVEAIFAGVTKWMAIIQKAVDWMRGNGHVAAADYLTTSGHVA